MCVCVCIQYVFLVTPQRNKPVTEPTQLKTTLMTPAVSEWPSSATAETNIHSGSSETVGMDTEIALTAL